jgi:hypothetical protein
MDDMNAFEHQIASVVQQTTRSPRPVDVMSIVRTSTARSPKWRFQPMFSATKFVVAGVIVALFGGFLLAGVLTTPNGDEMAPAAVTDSPSPMTTEELLSGMVTEEAEPGVFRVLNDGVRDLSFEGLANAVVAGHDGSIWLWRPKDFVRLGSPAEKSHEWPKGSSRGGLMVARDGTVWMHDGPEGRQVSRLRSNDGESWTVHLRAPALGALTIAPDGTVWGTYAGEDEEAGLIVARLGADGWEPLDGTTPAWVGDIFVTQSGEVWVAVAETMGDFSMWRFSEDDGEWEKVAVDAVRLPHGPFGHGIEVGADGTVWFAGIEPLMADGEPVLDAEGHARPGNSFLMRFDGSEWRRWGPADGVPSPPFAADIDLEQAPDGGLWMTMFRYPFEPLTEHEGTSRFDGSTWQHYLSGHRITSMEVAPDGSVWLLAEGNLYVITPEAVAATE